MKYFPQTALGGLAAVLLSAGACRPDQPATARWVNTGLAVLRLRHATADGSLADEAPTVYVQLPLPR